jgi:threonyl-tRNA synthetase
MAEYKEEVAQKPRDPIKITLPDGTIKEGKAWETTPLSIAKGISKSLANATVISKVNDEVCILEVQFQALNPF